MPQPYALQVFSQPKAVDEKAWTQWYTEEHLRDIVHFKAAATAALYREIAEPAGASEDEAQPFQGKGKTFYAFYQTEKPHPLTTLEFTTRVRTESELLPAGKTYFQSGDLQPLDLELSGTLGAASKEDVGPYIVYIEAIKDNGRHLNSWVANEHLKLVQEVKGYRRTLIYRPNSGPPTDASEGSGHAIVIDEFDALDADTFGTFEEALESAAAEKQVNFQARALKLVSDEGYGGKVREPLRLKADP